MLLHLRRKVSKVWWKAWSFAMAQHIQINEKSTMYVVSAFPRSGSSLFARLFEKSGITFGPDNVMKEVSDLNPDGFYENLMFYSIVDRLFREAGWEKSYGIMEDDIKAKGFVRRMTRIYTRRRLKKFIGTYSTTYDRWGVKISPLGVPFLKGFSGKNIKLVGVYRDPFTSIHSLMKVFRNGEQFATMLRYWEECYRELLYQLFIYDGILVRYEDIQNPETQEATLRKLTEFIGCGEVEKLRGLIKPALNRSSQGIEKLRESYPLTQSQRELLESLERIKI